MKMLRTVWLFLLLLISGAVSAFDSTTAMTQAAYELVGSRCGKCSSASQEQLRQAEQFLAESESSAALTNPARILLLADLRRHLASKLEPEDSAKLLDQARYSLVGLGAGLCMSHLCKQAFSVGLQKINGIESTPSVLEPAYEAVDKTLRDRVERAVAQSSYTEAIVVMEWLSELNPEGYDPEFLNMVNSLALKTESPEATIFREKLSRLIN